MVRSPASRGRRMIRQNANPKRRTLSKKPDQLLSPYQLVCMKSFFLPEMGPAQWADYFQAQRLHALRVAEYCGTEAERWLNMPATSSKDEAGEPGRYLDRKEAAKLLGVSLKTIVRREQAGFLTPHLLPTHKAKVFYKRGEMLASRLHVGLMDDEAPSTPTGQKN
jgi:hypothetical protein